MGADADEGDVEASEADADAYASEGLRYLPPLDYNSDALEAESDSQVLPCFPLGEAVYTPGTRHVLSIIEPRYRELYDDILVSGSRRFVVPQVRRDEATGRSQMAEVGVVFYLDDLQEVSEETNGKVKYICSHTVIGRVRLKRVLNPRAYADRSTYLRVEAEDLVDTDPDADCGEAEMKLVAMVGEVAELQAAAEPGAAVRLGDLSLSLSDRNATRGPGFWSLVTLWQDYLGFRIRECQQRFEQQLQVTLLSYFRQAEELPAVPEQVSLRELPEAVQKDVVNLQRQLKEEAEPLVRAQSHRLQTLLQSSSHRERLALLAQFGEADKRWLNARLAIRVALEDGQRGVEHL